MADGILTPCNVTRSRHWFCQAMHPAMWHVALESWESIHQVAAPCNVIRGSGITCFWVRPNVRHIVILHLVSISTHHRSRHVILHQSLKFYPNRTTIGRKKNDVMSIFKMADLSYLGFWESNNGFLEKPNYITSYRSSVDTIPLNCLVFEKIAFFCILATTDRQTEK